MSKFNLFSIFSKPKNQEIFYKMFEESATTCKQAASLFLKILKEGCNEDLMVTARQYKHKSNKIFKKTVNILNKTKMRSSEKVDIQNVALMLNKITKKIVKACMNYRVYRIEHSTEHMQMQANTLIFATDELQYIMLHLSTDTSFSEIMDRNLKMKEIETRGDEIHYLALDLLFSGQYDALRVIKYRDIHKDIESALDTCYNVTDAVTNMVMKDDNP
ncbi:MAG: DUF47 domain-containing protein [Candidatus Gastranaerophilaceae bacterium]